MAGPGTKRRRDGEEVRRPKKVKHHFKKQTDYHSSSDSDDEKDVSKPNLNEEDISASNKEPLGRRASPEKEGVAAKPLEPEVDVAPAPPEEADKDEVEDEDEPSDEEELEEVEVEDDDELSADEDLSGGSSDADTENAEEGGRKKRKRNDPSAFANSISKILASKLSTSKRTDPVLSRSIAATTASKELTDARLEAKAKRKLHAEKKQALEKGRVRDVLGLESTDVSTAQILEQEKRLKKTAQRGVVRLFNAVRAAQVQGDLARQEARKQGVVGMAQREVRVSEMSKKGFLDLIAQGGKKTAAAT